MSVMPKTSLEQWLAFKTVVDEGSFAKASEVLNKSQSSVSYAVQKLQERLPSPLFEQQGRKAELTELGQALYRHADNLIKQAIQLDRTAEYLASGWEDEVTIAADALVDMDKLFCALQQFSQSHPATRIRILETTLSGSEEALLRKQADIAILAKVPPGFLSEFYQECVMVPVASPSHPLFNLGREINETELAQHRQIVLRDTGQFREQDGGWLGAEQRWTVSHFATSINAIKNGLGFAFVPKSMIENELKQGVLKLLPLLMGKERRLSLYTVLADQSRAGPAAQKVFQTLLQCI